VALVTLVRKNWANVAVKLDGLRAEAAARYDKEEAEKL
jgi:hypothetical protein